MPDDMDRHTFRYCLGQAMNRHFGSRESQPLKLRVAYAQLDQLFIHTGQEFETVVDCVAEAIQEPTRRRDLPTAPLGRRLTARYGTDAGPEEVDAAWSILHGLHVLLGQDYPALLRVFVEARTSWRAHNQAPSLV